MALIVLENRRVRFLLLAHDDIENRVAPVLAGQGVAEIGFGQGERARAEGASVEDAGNEALPAQAPVGSATALGSFLNLELYSLSSHGAEV